MIECSELIAAILAITTFLLLITSKIIQYCISNKEDKTVVRSYIKGEKYSYQFTLDNGTSSLIIYNNDENIFNLEFYKIEYDFEKGKYISEEKYNIPKIRKLVKGEHIVIYTNIPDIVPNLKITWENIAGDKYSVIAMMNGRDGLTLSTIGYQKSLSGFLYNFFK